MDLQNNKVNHVKGNAVDYVLAEENRKLLHVCNNGHVMGSGIALEIKNRIPEAYTEYMNGSNNLGTITECRKVINMVAQDGYGKGIRHLNYGALARCLMFAKMRLIPVEYVIPYNMGADRAGGGWEIVKEMVEFFLLPNNITIVELSHPV